MGRKTLNVNVSVTPKVLKQWDQMAAAVNTTRSGCITYLMQLGRAFMSNKDFGEVMESIMRDALKKEKEKEK
jgi:hypothetical protein